MSFPTRGDVVTEASVPRCARGHRLVNGSIGTGSDTGTGTGTELPTVLFCPTCNTRYRAQADGTYIQVPDRPVR